MTPEQAAAFVIAQAACANAEIAAMQARDRLWAQNGLGTYADHDYLAVIEKYCIGHNAVLQCFQDANR
jgi:hypothetical protein